MEIQYEKKDLNHRVSNDAVKKVSGTTRNVFSFWRVIWTALIGFLLLFLLAYILGIPPVSSSVGYILTAKAATTVVYKNYTIAFDTQFPANYKDLLKAKLEKVAYKSQKRFTFIDDSAKSDYILTVESGSEFKDANIVPVYTSYLIPVGHLYWIKDGITTDDLKNKSLYTTQQDQGFAGKLVSDALGKDVKLQASANLPNDLKSSENRIGIIDISELNINYKLLTLDGHYFLDDTTKGSIPYSVVVKKQNSADSAGIGIISFQLQDVLGAEVSKEDILKVNITGTTAISRAIGMKTLRSGDGGYAAQNIGSFLKNADLVTTNNEVSFVPGCNPANNVMTFCTDPAAIKALKDSGVNIIQLTGNHNNDYGYKADTNSINMYKALGWDYFGGGLNAADAAKILYKDMKGTKVAFLGYNYYDSVQNTSALARGSNPGANSWSNAKVSNDIKTARANGADIVIVSFEYQECWAYPDAGYANLGYGPCYAPLGYPDQKKDFRYAIDAGADIVVQENDPQPQTYEIYKGKAIFYSLGNLFFDQTPWLGTRQGLVLTNYFYKGKYLTTKITTTLYGNDMRVYVTTGQQRSVLLTSLKNARQ